MKRHVLIVDSEPDHAHRLQGDLQSEILKVDIVDRVSILPNRLAERHYSLVVLRLGDQVSDFAETLELIRDRGASVLLLAEARQAHAANLDHGPDEYLILPAESARIATTVRRLLRQRQARDHMTQLRKQISKRFAFHNLLSKNERMHKVFELIAQVAPSSATVLIEGETGTGKEQVALAIHQASQAGEGPLVACNCAALPETLLESELFGHEKGAFTGALAQRQGRFELANGGTLFLDEVGDIPPSMQAKLLRVLQERRFERVGGAEPIDVDVRMIAATNRPLHDLVRDKQFREDLYYRLNVVRIELPPLRDRIDDIPLLVQHFLERYGPARPSTMRVAPDFLDTLMKYSWPGNVRELENVMERACVLCLDGHISTEQLPPELLHGAPTQVPFAIDLNRSLPDLLRETTRELEQQYLRRALELSGGNVGECARLCGLSRRSVTSKLAEYDIDRAAFKRMARSRHSA